MRGILRWLVNSPHKWSVTRNFFSFDDVIMCSIRLGQGNGWMLAIIKPLKIKLLSHKRWTSMIGRYHRYHAMCSSVIDSSYKSQTASNKYHILNNFVTEMCIRGTDVFRVLYDTSIKYANHTTCLSVITYRYDTTQHIALFYILTPYGAFIIGCIWVSLYVFIGSCMIITMTS